MTTKQPNQAPETTDTQALKTAINPPHLSDSLRLGFSKATVTDHNTRLIHISGQLGLDGSSANDFESQVDRAFENMLSVLEAAGGEIHNVIKINLLVKDHGAGKFSYLREKRIRTFPTNPPASTLIPVPRLVAEAALFEIDAVAVLPLAEK